MIIIITKYHNNSCSVGGMELCLLNLLLFIDCFLCNSYPCVLFENLPHLINLESHVYLWNFGEIYLVHFLRFWNLCRFTLEISKFQKSELGKLIPNFPLKHVIISTNVVLSIINQWILPAEITSQILLVMKTFMAIFQMDIQIIKLGEKLDQNLDSSESITLILWEIYADRVS